MTTIKSEMDYRRIAIPCGIGESAFLVERRSGMRIAIRINKSTLFFTASEAHQVVEAVLELLGMRIGAQ